MNHDIAWMVARAEYRARVAHIERHGHHRSEIGRRRAPGRRPWTPSRSRRRRRLHTRTVLAS